MNSQDTISAVEFRNAMSRISYSVSVVSITVEGKTYAKTINTLTPVSADDPSILISLFHASEITQKIIEARRFVVSVLNDSQMSLAEEFAGRPPQDPPVETPSNDEQANHLLITNAVATFHCTVAVALTHATHVILIGRINDIAESDRLPLLHHRRAYRVCAEQVVA